MSQYQSKRVDLQFILPKKGSSTGLLPKEDSSKNTETKTIDLHIEDLLERLNDAVQRKIGDQSFTVSPVFLLGEQRVHASFFCLNNRLYVEVCVADDGGYYCDLRSILVTGSCGNLTLEKRTDAGADEKQCDGLFVELGSIEDLKEAMNTSGNHKLDLQLTITALVTGGWDDNDQWIIPK